MTKLSNKNTKGGNAGGLAARAAGAIAGAISQNKKPNTVSAYNLVKAAKKIEQDASTEIENVRGLMGTGMKGADKMISDARKRADYMNSNAKRYRSLANDAVKKATGRDYPLATSPSFPEE